MRTDPTSEGPERGGPGRPDREVAVVAEVALGTPGTKITMRRARPWRVLLIDDSELTLELAAELLREDGFEVRACLTIDELDGQLADWTPQLIVTDVNMPGLTGVELCRLLKQRYDTAHVPIVLCSMRSETELEALARTCDANGFISKEGGLGDLAGELRSLCESLVW